MIRTKSNRRQSKTRHSNHSTRAFAGARSNRVGHVEALEPRLPLAANLVIDSNTVPITLNPGALTVFQDQVYFSAYAAEVPTAELWKTDGTSAGTQFVAELGEGEIVQLAAVNETLIAVTQRDRDHSHRINALYATDGTQTGTRQLADELQFNGYNWDVFDLHVFDDLAVWAADTGALTDHQQTIFVTDGTVGGTKAGPACFCGKDPGDLVEFAGKIFFASDRGLGSLVNGRLTYRKTPSLEAFDPVSARSIDDFFRTAGESEIVLDLGESQDPRAEREPRDLTVVGDRLYFTASGDRGRELWVTDGTAEGTMLVADPTNEASNPAHLLNHQGALYFTAEDSVGDLKLWTLAEPADNPAAVSAVADADIISSDGGLYYVVAVDGDTREVRATQAGGASRIVGTIPAQHANLTVFGDALLYTNQTGDGTRLFSLADGSSTELGRVGSNPRDFTVHAGRVLFSAEDDNGARTLWAYDSSGLGEVTVAARNGSLATDRIDFYQGLVVDGQMTGQAVVGVAKGAGKRLTAVEFPGTSFDVQVMITDGTKAGTRLTDARRMSGWSAAVAVAGRVHVAPAWAPIESDDSWWQIDTATREITKSSANRLSQADPRYGLAATCQFCTEAVVFEGAALQNENAQAATGLSFSERAALGIRLVPASLDPAVRTVLRAGDLVYFVADSVEYGRELWQTDGSVEGTHLVRDIMPGKRGSGVELLGVSGETLFFTAQDGAHGRELWSANVNRTDGSNSKSAADIDRNGAVEFADFLILSANFGSRTEPTTNGDLDGDGIVDFADFLMFSAEYRTHNGP